MYSSNYLLTMYYPIMLITDYVTIKSSNKQLTMFYPTKSIVDYHLIKLIPNQPM